MRGRLKRVFNIEVLICPKCGGEAKVIACIENQAVCSGQLLQDKGVLPPPPELRPVARASPQVDWFEYPPFFRTYLRFHSFLIDFAFG